MGRVRQGTGQLRVVDWRAQAEELQAALRWAGCTKGRGAQLPRLLRDVFERGKRTNRHLLAFHEAREVIDLYRAWQGHRAWHAAILPHIRRCISKGPLIADEENTKQSTNRPRNSAFVLYLAGCLLGAGFHVLSVEGVALHSTTPRSTADVLLSHSDQLVAIECKRPHSRAGLPALLEKAAEQLANAPATVLIVAVDYSLALRGPGMVLSVPADRHTYAPVPGRMQSQADRAHDHIADRLESEVAPLVKRVAPPSWAGALLFARIPTMVSTHHSRVLGPAGAPLTYQTPVSVSSSLAWVRTENTYASVLKEIALGTFTYEERLNSQAG